MFCVRMHVVKTCFSKKDPESHCGSENDLESETILKLEGQGMENYKQKA